MPRPQFQRAFRPSASDEDLERTRVLWTTTGLSATQIGLTFTPPVTKNVILGRVKKLKLVGSPRPPRPSNVVALPPPEKRPQPTHLRKSERAPKIPEPVIDQTPAEILGHLGLSTATMRPFGDRRTTECAYVIDAADGPMSCCGPITRGAYCDLHAGWCYEGPPK